jgi:hypothetical protein
MQTVNMPDVCCRHGGSRITASDVHGHNYVVKRLQATESFFRKTMFASSLLAELLKAIGISGYLKRYRRTRFATIYASATALYQCAPAVVMLLNSWDIVMVNENDIHEKRHTVPHTHYHHDCSPQTS